MPLPRVEWSSDFFSCALKYFFLCVYGIFSPFSLFVTFQDTIFLKTKIWSKHFSVTRCDYTAVSIILEKKLGVKRLILGFSLFHYIFHSLFFIKWEKIVNLMTLTKPTPPICESKAYTWIWKKLLLRRPSYIPSLYKFYKKWRLFIFLILWWTARSFEELVNFF